MLSVTLVLPNANFCQFISSYSLRYAFPIFMSAFSAISGTLNLKAPSWNSAPSSPSWNSASLNSPSAFEYSLNFFLPKFSSLDIFPTVSSYSCGPGKCVRPVRKGGFPFFNVHSQFKFQPAGPSTSYSFAVLESYAVAQRNPLLGSRRTETTTYRGSLITTSSWPLRTFFSPAMNLYGS